MLSKSLRGVLFFLVAASLLSLGYFRTNARIQAAADKTYLEVNAPALVTGPIYIQPVDPAGKLLLSSWLDPDGSDSDQYVWDNFTIQSNQTITEIDWYGVYDPAKFGAGGPVLDFSVSLYLSIAAGTEPDVAHPPLVHYQSGGNAGETSIGTVGGNPMYAYVFSLPTPFMASAGVKYWVQIEAFQHGSIPDWCLAGGAGGDGSHFRRTSGAGGDILYRSAPGDAAFTLLGPLPDTATPTNTATNTPTPTATDTPTATSTDTATFTNTPTDTPTSTPTNTPTPTDTPTPTPTDTATPTPTPTDTPTSTPTATPSPTSTSTPTSTWTVTAPQLSTPGRVVGNGKLGLKRRGIKSSFRFWISYRKGDAKPRGSFYYTDPKAHLVLTATSFDQLVIKGSKAKFTGLATVNGRKNVPFEVNVIDSSKHGSRDSFTIKVPSLDGYSAGGTLVGGNITVHKTEKENHHDDDDDNHHDDEHERDD